MTAPHRSMAIEPEEIEITAEMIDAGVTTMYAYENDELWTTPEERVCAIFRSMLKAKPPEEESVSSESARRK
jgi:hypothetical protein